MKFPICVACGTTKDLQHHHLVPRAEGGNNEPSNLITLCTSCHHKMHSRQMNGVYNHGELVRVGIAKIRNAAPETIKARHEIGLQKHAKRLGLSFTPEPLKDAWRDKR